MAWQGLVEKPMIPWLWLQKLLTRESSSHFYPDCCFVTGYEVMGQNWKKEWEKCEMKRLRKNVVPHRISRCIRMRSVKAGFSTLSAVVLQPMMLGPIVSTQKYRKRYEIQSWLSWLLSLATARYLHGATAQGCVINTRTAPRVYWSISVRFGRSLWQSPCEATSWTYYDKAQPFATTLRFVAPDSSQSSMFCSLGSLGGYPVPVRSQVS